MHRPHCSKVAETCQMALQRIEYLAAHPDASNEESPYYSVDPAPALPASTPIAELRQQLLDESMRMFDGGVEAVKVLGEVFSSCRSALLRHEVAYVLGQMQDQAAADVLVAVLKDSTQHAMVRHEAAESLGSIGDNKTKRLLAQFSQDAEPIVAHSCVVALDMLEFEASGAFEYADKGAGAAVKVC
ncbi:deoxyhypusine monooxygenase, partial [Haematococcus lacustris]